MFYCCVACWFAFIVDAWLFRLRGGCVASCFAFRVFGIVIVCDFLCYAWIMCFGGQDVSCCLLGVLIVVLIVWCIMCLCLWLAGIVFVVLLLCVCI